VSVGVEEWGEGLHEVTLGGLLLGPVALLKGVRGLRWLGSRSQGVVRGNCQS
jgi:hypothetical protein